MQTCVGCSRHPETVRFRAQGPEKGAFKKCQVAFLHLLVPLPLFAPGAEVWGFTEIQDVKGQTICTPLPRACAQPAFAGVFLRGISIIQLAQLQASGGFTFLMAEHNSSCGPRRTHFCASLFEPGPVHQKLRPRFRTNNNTSSPVDRIQQAFSANPMEHVKWWELILGNTNGVMSRTNCHKDNPAPLSLNNRHTTASRYIPDHKNGGQKDDGQMGSRCLAIIRRWSSASDIAPAASQFTCPANAAKPHPQICPKAAKPRPQSRQGGGTLFASPCLNKAVLAGGSKAPSRCTHGLAQSGAGSEDAEANSRQAATF